MKPEKEVIELLKSIKTFLIAGLQLEKQNNLVLEKQNKRIILELEKLNRKMEDNNDKHRRGRSWRRFFGIKRKVE